MQFFEQPYVIIIGLILCSVVLAALGVYFAVRGAKAAENTGVENDFVRISKLENNYIKAGKAYEYRSVFFINVSLDNFKSLHTATQTANIFSQIKNILREVFSGDKGSSIAINEENSFVVFTKWPAPVSRKRINDCLEKINECLVEHSAVTTVDVAIGVYFVIGMQVSFDVAMGRAKQAYLLAKENNLPCFEWDAAGGKAIEQRVKIENNIEKEIDNNRFFLEYQPVLDANTKKIIGAEVLSRLNSESEGILTPGSFLSAVDSVGINDKFDYYIFEKNCKWISNDKEQREAFQYTINFSRSTLCEAHFADKIIKIANKYELNPSCLAIEILEDKNIVGAEKQQMIENLSKLKNFGISILLDDFGKGYTTFSDLQNLDITILKIDKQLTQDSVSDTGFIILKNIIRTAKDIGMKTLCEGIETEEQEESAILAGCDLLQGYYYYKPMPVADFENLLIENAN